jgi:prepilin-type N-terminal cleavage/methylation domain-containing protein
MTRPLPRPAPIAARGYTAIEVLMAMTVMAIGGAAVITMQKTSMTANLDARRADVANSIARTWVERLQRDSMGWTQPGPEAAGNNIGNAPLLAAGIAAQGQWFLPTQESGITVPETMSPGFDILGRDLPAAQLATADFCVNVRLSWLTTTLVPPGGDLIRADVRVIWPIGIINSRPGFCNPTTAAAFDPNTDPGANRDPGADPSAPIFHALYLTTSIKENTAP